MRQLLILLALGLMSVGCIKIKSNQEIRSAPEMTSEDLQGNCRSIHETGNIFELLGRIKSDTRQVISLVSETSPTEEMAQIEYLAQEVRKNSDLVMTLAQKDWNHPVVTSEINWRIQDRDLPFHPRLVSMKSAEILKIYFQGTERPELRKKFKTRFQGPDLVVTYKGLSTLLEYCQFNETLMVILEVKYRAPLGLRSKFFHLYVKPGEL